MGAFVSSVGAFASNVGAFRCLSISIFIISSARRTFFTFAAQILRQEQVPLRLLGEGREGEEECMPSSFLPIFCSRLNFWEAKKRKPLVTTEMIATEALRLSHPRISTASCARQEEFYRNAKNRSSDSRIQNSGRLPAIAGTLATLAGDFSPKK